jgi:hypothetical protein
VRKKFRGWKEMDEGGTREGQEGMKEGRGRRQGRNERGTKRKEERKGKRTRTFSS